jgi:hypothetical protein
MADKCPHCGCELHYKEVLQNGRCSSCYNKTKVIRDYESLRRWAAKRLADSYNLWIMQDAIRDIHEAFSKYIKLSTKEIEVEE